MNDRTKRINQAILESKSENGRICQACGRNAVDGWIIEGAHLFVRNSPTPGITPDNPEYIVPLCSTCHSDYDPNKSPDFKILWLERKGLRKQAAIIYEATTRKKYDFDTSLYIGDRRGDPKPDWKTAGIPVSILLSEKVA